MPNLKPNELKALRELKATIPRGFQRETRKQVSTLNCDSSIGRPAVLSSVLDSFRVCEPSNSQGAANGTL